MMVKVTDRQREAIILCINDKWQAPASALQRKEQGHAYTHRNHVGRNPPSKDPFLSRKVASMDRNAIL